MITLDYKDSRPIYEQITEKFKTLILKGVLAENTQMPSVRALAMDLATNPNTVQKAYAELERQGFTYSVQGRGSFVRGDLPLLEAKKNELASRMQRLLGEAAEFGITKEELLQAAEAMKGGTA